MIHSKVIIVGGGPAGSTCAWRLCTHGIECLILDKEDFPRPKLCAGWITPQVIKDLQIDVETYPLSLQRFDRFHVHISQRDVTLKVHQYAIRRYEFDEWLLKRSGAAIQLHNVKDITKSGDAYVIDDRYRCHYLIGAGGTNCPVYRTFFKGPNPRAKGRLIVTLEAEFPYDYKDGDCHLWFVQNKFPGYSWYVPKGSGHVNIGIGGFSERLKDNNDTIQRHWGLFLKELERLSLVKNYHVRAKGYMYYVRDGVDIVHKDGVFLTGDAAGLATKDMGEGIGPAVESGILAADAIIKGKPFALRSVKQYSFPRYRARAKVSLLYLMNAIKDSLRTGPEQ
jgi:flavin-dependent dehydrogenase